jgi:hypothetical protein
MLIGARTALVPLGLSCQPAHQIEAHRALAETLCGESLRRRTTPFDWRIVGLADIAAMIEDDEFWPRAAGEIWLEEQADPPGSGSLRTKRYWPRRRCWFWHETQRSHLVFSLKQAHLAQNFARLAEVERRIFFVSNLQNNLAPLRQTVELAITADDALRCWRALERRFGACSLHLVTRPELTAGMPPGSADEMTQVPNLPVYLHIAPPDAPDMTWKGADQTWQSVLHRALAAADHPSPAH